MDALSKLLEPLKKDSRIEKHFLGLLHVLIGRRINTADGQLVSSGLTWRELAAKLKKVRWDPAAADKLNIAVKDLPPRDRTRFWYLAISRAQVDSTAAMASAHEVAKILLDLGYVVSVNDPV
jgi:hypothetical protein